MSKPKTPWNNPNPKTPPNVQPKPSPPKPQPVPPKRIDAIPTKTK